MQELFTVDHFPGYNLTVSERCIPDHFGKTIVCTVLKGALRGKISFGTKVRTVAMATNEDYELTKRNFIRMAKKAVKALKKCKA